MDAQFVELETLKLTLQLRIEEPAGSGSNRRSLRMGTIAVTDWALVRGLGMRTIAVLVH